jgi:hypothetical protein
MSAEPSLLAGKRAEFHKSLLSSGVLALSPNQSKQQSSLSLVPTNADSSNARSVQIARRIYDQIESSERLSKRLSSQKSGQQFEVCVRNFVQETFLELGHLRPGNWQFPSEPEYISGSQQYAHLASIAKLSEQNPELEILVGSDYLIKPDVLILRIPSSDEELNARRVIVDDGVATRSSLRARFNPQPLLHASISCKWTIRSDRAQNSRSEALNLIRNRKGHVPHVVVVTGEPMPSRLASLALGTGDLDCVYHFALPELIHAASGKGFEDSADSIKIMVEGKRLKDISDLPLDLAI